MYMTKNIKTIFTDKKTTLNQSNKTYQTHPDNVTKRNLPNKTKSSKTTKFKIALSLVEISPSLFNL